MKFTEFNLDPDLLKGIEETGFQECLPVQESTLPVTLEGKDVTVQSQTGTGKTAAFLITIFERLKRDARTRGKKALIVVPTRELAVQIEKDAREIGSRLSLVMGCFYGGVGYHQQETLIRQDVDVMIGTPGRLLDLNGSGKLSFKDVAILVIDEADRLFDMGFLPDIRRMMRRMMPPQHRQTMLFSATLGYQARTIAREFMNHPIKIEIQPEKVTVDKITQVMYHVGHREKIPLLLGLLKRDRPDNTLIFTNTKHMAERVNFHLRANGYASQFLIGDLPQKKRLRIISEFKAGRIPILVATDVAARGLHIEGLDLVVNYDLPGDCENYVHRIGRTARAGKSGKAISLACDDFIFNLDAIQEFIGMSIRTEPVDPGLLVPSQVSDREYRDRRRDGNRPSQRPGSRNASQARQRRDPRRGTSAAKRRASEPSRAQGQKKRVPQSARKGRPPRREENSQASDDKQIRPESRKGPQRQERVSTGSRKPIQRVNTRNSQQRQPQKKSPRTTSTPNPPASPAKLGRISRMLRRMRGKANQD